MKQDLFHPREGEGEGRSRSVAHTDWLQTWGRHHPLPQTPTHAASAAAVSATVSATVSTTATSVDPERSRDTPSSIS